MWTSEAVMLSSTFVMYSLCAFQLCMTMKVSVMQCTIAGITLGWAIVKL